jgi:hypothetical protein
MQGISLIANFDVNAPFPIDSRLVVNDTTERDNIIWKYEGLKVYVLSERQSYIWQDSVWRVEYNGIYGGSGSLPGNVSVDFGSFSNTVVSASNYFQYEVDSQNSYSYLQNQFIRHTAGVSGQNDAWQGIEFRQQLKYNNGGGLKESSYVSFNPKSVLGGISFGTGDSLTNTVSERMVITGDGRVGISTNSPQSVLQIGSYSSTNELPLVFDIRTARGSSIGYNWYYRSSDNFFLVSKGSSRLSFSTNGLTILNRSSGSLISSMTHSLHISSETNIVGNVGIKTLDPRGLLQIGASSSTTRPIVIHNDSLSSGVGYNWFYNGQDNVFDPTKSSYNISFETSGMNIKTRAAGQPSSSFDSYIFIGTNNRIGIRTTSPTYHLDVNGVINGRDGVRSDKGIYTTDGYYFKNSTVANISSANNIITFIADIGSNFTMNATQNISSKNLRVVTSNVTIASSLSPDNSRHTEGLVFEAQYNGQGSGIYHYQGLQSNADMGISVLSKFSGQDRESLRISNGGKRIQIGVPSNVTISHDLTTSSQIDTTNDMYSTSRVTVTKQSNLLLSGRYTHTQGTTTIIQRWSRVGSIVHVQLYAYAPTISTGLFPLSSLQIETPVTSIQDGYGIWISDGSDQGVIRYNLTTSKMMFKASDSFGNAPSTPIYSVTANYTIEIQ